MNALRQWLYRGTLSCAMCFIIALTLYKVAIKNEQSIETDNCITTIIYILSFTDTIFMYQGQLINTEILSDLTLTLYNRTYHVNVKYHKSSVWNCHSEDKHNISIGILIPSTTKYINMCSIVFIVPFYLIT
jgi:ABC-type uncharacterized transport system substrate-binding protein